MYAPWERLIAMSDRFPVHKVGGSFKFKLVSLLFIYFVIQTLRYASNDLNEVSN